MSDVSFPLSPGQQRLWFLDRLEPGSAAYNVPIVLDLDGPLDVGALESALDHIVRRHESLRTVFPATAGVPRQVIVAPGQFHLTVEDLVATSPDQRDDRTTERIVEETRRPFDLTTGPLLRAVLLKVSSLTHILVVTVHHIVFDAWSAGIFLRELRSLYTSRSAGTPDGLPELPARYVDFAVRQREWLDSPACTRQLSYWTAQLTPLPAPLRIPADYPQSAQASDRGGHEILTLPGALRDQLDDWSRQQGVPPFVTLLSAYATLLHRFTGQSDIVVGTTIANRSRQEFESLVGFFVNTLPLRLDLSATPTFRDLVHRAKRVAYGAYSNQDLPFETLVERINPDRSTSRAPIAQTLLVFNNTPFVVRGELAAGALTIRRRVVTTGTAKFDLSLIVNRTERDLRVGLEFRTSLFERPTAVRLLTHLRRLLEGIVENPDQSIDRLPLLPDDDKGQLLVAWNRTARAYTGPETVIGLFGDHAQRTPEAVAVVCGHEQVTYADLAARAEAIARRLRGLGVGPDDRVGLCLPRSAALVEWMLGILTAGGAYLPLDPSYPPARLALVLDGADAKVVVTDRESSQRLPSGPWTTMLVDESDEPAVSSRNEETIPVVAPESLAYVVYTSGSTGRPKGVALEHRQIVNLVRWALEEFQPDERAQMLAATSIGFDVSLFELLVPLCGGTTIVLAEDILALVRHALPVPVTFVNAVPSVMAEVMRAGRLVGYVKVVALAGEPLNQTLVRQLYDSGCVEEVYDLYGPSETHVATAARRSREGTSTIGRPISNMQAFVLDPSGEPCPIGVPGELFLAGKGLARGYLGPQALTDERFVHRSVDGGPAIRMYRTGDLVRWQSAGTLEFIGRMDHQVKIRGVRVELAEIDEVLRSHPSVVDAVTVKSEYDTGGRLVAYLVPQAAIANDALRHFLEQRLPRSMVPSEIVQLSQFPRLPSGKVDRARLPAPPVSEPAVGSMTSPDAIELGLVSLWSEVLGLRSVGIDQGFFELGGHSLLAIRLFAEISARYGVDLPLVSLFQDGTVRSQARLIRNGSSARAWSPVVPIQPRGTRPPLFLVHGVGGEVLSFEALAARLGTDQPTYGLHADLTSGTGFFSSVESVAARYVEGVRSVAPTGPYRIGGYSSGGVIAFEMAQQLSAAGENVTPLIMLDSPVPGASRRERLTPQQLGRMLRNAFYWPIDDDFFRSTPRDQAARLRSKLRKLLRNRSAVVEAGTALDIRDELALWRMPASTLEYLDAHIQMIRAYQCRPYRGAIQIVRARTSRLMSRAAPDLGWQSLALGGVTVCEVPGAHDTILREPRVTSLAATLSTVLRTSQS